MCVEGVLWIVRTGSPWRDLPDAVGEWNSVFRRFRHWSQTGVWWRSFAAMAGDPAFEYLIVNSTSMRPAPNEGLAIEPRPTKRSDVRAAA